MKPSTGAGFVLLAMCALFAKPTESLLILDILKVAQMSFNSFYHTWDLFEAKLQPGPDSPYYQEKTYPEEFVMKDHPSFFVKKDEMSLIAKINEINRKIAGIEDKMRMHEESVMRQLELIPHVIMTEMKVNQVLDVVRDVESLHERFTRYMKTGVTEIKKEGKPSLDRSTIINFANFVTSHQPSTPLSFLDRLHAIIVPHLDSDRLLGTKSFFYTFRDYMVMFTDNLHLSKCLYLFRGAGSTKSNFQKDIGYEMVSPRPSKNNTYQREIWDYSLAYSAEIRSGDGRGKSAITGSKPDNCGKTSFAHFLCNASQSESQLKDNIIRFIHTAVHFEFTLLIEWREKLLLK